MDLIETMAKAAWDAVTDEFNKWDSTDAEEKIHAMDGMRAALLTLAEFELSDGCVDLGNMAFNKCPALNDSVRASFSAMLRSIANGEPS